MNEDLISEMNARNDYPQEAYGGSAPDPLYEMYCNDSDEGFEGTFDEYVRQHRAHQAQLAAARREPTPAPKGVAPGEEIPF